MHSHRLTLESGSPAEVWLLQWDDATFALKAPNGETVLEVALAEAHRLFEPHELYSEGKISFVTPFGPLTFKPQTAAVEEVRALVDAGLRSDPEYRLLLRRQYRRVFALGLVMFVVAGGLFALYCWWASWAEDPPPGHWLYYVGWLIRLGLFLLLGAALAGPVLCFQALRQLRRLRRIERGLAEGSPI
jgi:hypothetical protein